MDGALLQLEFTAFLDIPNDPKTLRLRVSSTSSRDSLNTVTISTYSRPTRIE